MLMDTFPNIVYNCLLQEVPHLQPSTRPRHPQVLIREQFIITLIEWRSLDIAVGGNTSSFFLMSGMKRCFDTTEQIWSVGYMRVGNAMAIKDYV